MRFEGKTQLILSRVVLHLDALAIKDGSNVLLMGDVHKERGSEIWNTRLLMQGGLRRCNRPGARRRS